MNFSELKKLIGSVLEKAQCPHCSQKMGMGKAEILEVKDQMFAFRASCNVCGAKPIIQGNVKLQKSENLQNKKRKRVSQKISKKTIKGISYQLSNFSGKNIKDLF